MYARSWPPINKTFMCYLWADCQVKTATATMTICYMLMRLSGSFLTRGNERYLRLCVFNIVCIFSKIRLLSCPLGLFHSFSCRNVETEFDPRKPSYWRIVLSRVKHRSTFKMAYFARVNLGQRSLCSQSTRITCNSFVAYRTSTCAWVVSMSCSVIVRLSQPANLLR